MMVETLYNTGLGVSQDYELAMQWYWKAASKGNTSAQNNVGYLYQKGLGVSQDFELAMQLPKGIPEHKLALVTCMTMVGVPQVPQNFKLAMEWYLKAAKNGEPVAKNNIGVLYETGLGVSKNITIAIECYQFAAENGNEPEKESLKRLNEQRYYAKNEHKEGKDSNDALQKNFDILQQEQLQKGEEGKQLKERLVRLEAQLEENTINNFNYDSSENDNDNDINYNTETDNSEEDSNITNCNNNKGNTNADSNSKINKRSTKHVVNKVYANPNYGSSDNEDRSNDICYD